MAKVKAKAPKKQPLVIKHFKLISNEDEIKVYDKVRLSNLATHLTEDIMIVPSSEVELSTDIAENSPLGLELLHKKARDFIQVDQIKYRIQYAKREVI